VSFKVGKLMQERAQEILEDEDVDVE
jgi:hypothetical protein